MALTLAQQLTEAEAAYHSLMNGSAVASARDSDGSMVMYRATNASRLKAYIEDLKSQIAAETAGSNTTRYPMRLQF